MNKVVQKSLYNRGLAEVHGYLRTPITRTPRPRSAAEQVSNDRARDVQSAALDAIALVQVVPIRPTTRWHQCPNFSGSGRVLPANDFDSSLASSVLR